MATPRPHVSRVRTGRPTPTLPQRAVALACGSLLSGLALAQAPATPPAPSSPASTTITITGRGLATVGVAGFGDQPLARAPLQASSYGPAQLADAGVDTLGDLTRLDASVGDAYNAEGYWSILAVRGYTLDNRANYRRDGLPINAETSLALDNKERLELLRGTSGIQAGSSAPGGLVNLVVKRPAGRLRNAEIALRERGSVLTAVDLGQAYGEAQADGPRVGVRLNAAHERLDPAVRNTRGERSLLALAVDFRPAAGSLLQAEVESSRRRQPSVAGWSLLGDTVPDPRSLDLQRNLNDQPWRQPVVLEGDTASLRWQQALGGALQGWRFSAHAMTQRLRNDDRTAFPYGLYDANYECSAACDRFGADGSFTYWEFISDNERRDTDALELALAGSARTGGVGHALRAAVLSTRHRARFEDQVFDIAGTGRIDGSLQTPPSFGFTDANTDRSERSTELSLQDVMTLSPQWQLWAGLRHTRLERAAQRTSPASDGLRATAYDERVTVPWLALARALSPQTLVYASWGQGLETDVAPNRPRYVNAGQALPALKSRQFEIGLKHDGDDVTGSVTLFDIDRPQAADFGSCDVADSCTRRIDGSARHRGLEAQASLQQGAWSWQAGLMLLDAAREGSAQAGINGQRPVNVPERSLRLGTEWRVAALPGLALQAGLTAESDRVVLPYDASVRIPGWSRIDVGARWRQAWGERTLVWRAGIDNLTDRQAWKESPYQFGHVYLYPLAPRTWRASVSASF